jgi:hypothetical protein
MGPGTAADNSHSSKCALFFTDKWLPVHAGDVLDDAVACVVPDVHAARDALSPR